MICMCDTPCWMSCRRDAGDVADGDGGKEKDKRAASTQSMLCLCAATATHCLTTLRQCSISDGIGADIVARALGAWCQGREGIQMTRIHAPPLFPLAGCFALTILFRLF